MRYTKQVLLTMVAALVMSGIPARADVVTQYSFESNLDDTGAASTVADNLTDNTTSGVTYVPGVVGSAVNIELTPGSTNKITAADSADVRLGANWTLEAFVWPSADNNPAFEWERLWTKWGDGGEDYHFALRGATGQPVVDGIDLFVNGGNNIINHNNTASVPRETWSHVALVGDQTGGEITAWLNGTQVGSTPYVAVNATTGSMSFGNFADADQSGLQYSGYIDEALIHNAAVDADYLAGRAALIPEPRAILLAIMAMAAVVAIQRRP